MKYDILLKKFYVNKKKYEEFNSILFVRNEERTDDNFCLSCGEPCCELKKICYNKNCYRFITEFSYNDRGKKMQNKEELELSEEKDNDKKEIELCIGIAKNANLELINTKIDMINFENEIFIMNYLLQTDLEIDFTEILKFLPKVKKYSSIKKMIL
jgi:hypothetical protein